MAFRSGMLGPARTGWRSWQSDETWTVTSVPGRDADRVSTRPDWTTLFGDDGHTGRAEYENIKVGDKNGDITRYGTN